MRKLSKSLTVIVVAYNEEKNIERCINSILSQKCEVDFETLIVDDGSTDKTKEILKRYKNKVEIVQTPNLGPSHARNIAMNVSQSQWLVFFDADTIIDSNCLNTLYKTALKLKNKGKQSFSVGGKQSLYPGANKIEKTVADFLNSLGFVSDYLHESEEVIDVAHTPSCNVIFPRQSLIDVGGFDEKLWPCEDLDLDIRLKKMLGHQVFYNPQANIFHRRPQAYTDLFKMFYRYGKGHGLLVKKHGLCQKLHALPFVYGFILAFITSVFLKSVKFGIVSATGIIIFNVILWLLYRKRLIETLLFSCLFIVCITVWNLGFVTAMFISKTRFTHD